MTGVFGRTFSKRVPAQQSKRKRATTRGKWHGGQQRSPNALARPTRNSRARLAHVPAKWIRFADKDIRQHENLRRVPLIWDHRVIAYERKTLQLITPETKAV
jgi:hypothetical protein